MQTAKFVVTGRGAVNHNSEAKKKGDVIELTAQQARALRNLVEPHDDAGRALVARDPSQDTLRDHEVAEILQQEEAELQARLSASQARREALQRGMAERAPQGAPRVVEPAVEPADPKQ